MITIVECELHTLFKPGTTKLVKTPFTKTLPRNLREMLERSRWRELNTPVVGKGLVGQAIIETHAYILSEEERPYQVSIAVFDADPRTVASTLDEGLDLIDAIRDGIETAPKLRSHVLREVIEALDDLDDNEWTELEAYANAAGLEPWM